MEKRLSLIIQFGAIDKLSGAMKNIVGLGQKGTSVLAGMKREARELERELARVKAGLAMGSHSQSDVNFAAGNLAAMEARLARQGRLLQIDNRVAAMQARAAQLQGDGQNNMIGGAAMLTPFVLSAREAMNFSSGLVDIQQKAGLTNAEMAKMRVMILRAAEASHQLPEDMRQAVDVLAGFGMDPRQAALLAQPIGRLGTAFKVELPDASAAAYSAVNNLKLPLGEVARQFDIMAAAGNAGAFEVKDMARWFPGLTARMQVFGERGLPAIADLSAALQMAMNTAANSDEAANNIANLMDKVNSQETINAFSKKFGVDLPAALRKARAEGKTTMEAFAEISQMATGGDLEKLGLVVNDRQARMGLLALIQGMDKYRQIRADISKSAGTVDAAFDQRQAMDASLAWRDFRSQLSTLAIALGTTVLPTFNRFLGMVSGVMGAVARWADANPRLASTLMTVIAGFAAARVGLGALQFAFGTVLGPMATVWGWMARFGANGGFGMLARGAMALGPAIMGVGRAFMMAGAAMLTTPLGWIIMGIAAVAAGAYLIYKNWGRIGPFFRNLWTGVKNWFASIDWGETGRAVIRGIFAGMGFAWKAITTWLPAAGLALGNLLRNIDWAAVGSWLIGRIAWGLGAAWSGVKSWWFSAWTAIKNYVANMSWADIGLAIARSILAGLTGALSVGGFASRLGQSIRNAAPGAIAAARQGWSQGTSTATLPPIAGKRARGGPVQAGSTYLVGEEGPELLRTGASGTILPNRAFRAMNDNSGGMTVNISVTQRAGEDGEALARRVADLIRRQTQGQKRASYYDA